MKKPIATAMGFFYQQRLSTLSRHPDESTTTVIQPGDKCKAKASSGLEVPPAATFSTCV